MFPLAYIGPGPGFAVQAPFLLTLLGLFSALLVLLFWPVRYLWRRPKRRGKARARRVVILGLDGLEPSRVERLLEQGRLPHLQALRRQGDYRRLATTCPPLSPVAWSTFSTGVHPGRHGIFDFVHRDSHFRPRLAFSEVENGKPRFLRRSRSFWDVLGEHGVFSHILRVPVTWPPQPFFGLLLSAMGVPDLRGSQGTYTLFSPEPEVLDNGHHVLLEADGEALKAYIPGPQQKQLPLRLLGNTLQVAASRLELQLDCASEWVRLDFGGVRGLAQFVLVEPDRLYMTPLQLDPERPAMPLSWPATYAVTLAKLHGPFATCGLAEDTGAREDGVLSQKAFLEQVSCIHAERERQFLHCLRRTTEGLCAVVFDGPDRLQHMLMHDQQALDKHYEEFDQLVGRTQKELGAEDVLMVLSDHGFAPWKRFFDVNCWLAQEGYLVHQQGEIDWAATRAYSLGLAGIHLKGENLEELKLELSRRLTELVDPETGESPLLEVFDAEKLYRGPYVERAPHLVLGFRAGYRVSKASARGEIGEQVFGDNRSAWSGDHCYHPDSVPGVLFCNRPLQEQPHLVDLAPSVLHLFGVPQPGYMEGSNILCER